MVLQPCRLCFPTIDEAEQTVERAEAKLDEAETYNAMSASERSVVELKVAKATAYGARDRLRSLRSRWAAEHAAQERRETAEAAFSERDRRGVAKRLEKARDEAVSAIVEAERAAARVLAAVGAYSGAVREASDMLVGKGLRVDEGGVDGGSTVGTVVLGGETFRPADGGSMLAAILQSTMAEHYQQYVFAQIRFAQLGGLADRAARAELLTRAAER
ncbi:hypothetical protein [Streptomyces sp. 1222.5]|uniref:hypothetical protein n=1 Tax=Streptomyces sp. 1222.5 TaxID=1881026 RepID=UPI003D73B297